MTKKELKSKICNEFINASSDEQAKVINNLLANHETQYAKSLTEILFRGNKTKFALCIKNLDFIHGQIVDQSEKVLRELNRSFGASKIFNDMIKKNLYGDYLSVVPKFTKEAAFHEKLKLLDKSFTDYESMIKKIIRVSGDQADSNIDLIDKAIERKKVGDVIGWVSRYLSDMEKRDRVDFYGKLSNSELRKIFWLAIYSFDYRFDLVASGGEDSMSYLFGYNADELKQNISEITNEIEDWKNNFAKKFSSWSISKVILFLDFIHKSNAFPGYFPELLINSLTEKLLREVILKRPHFSVYMSHIQILQLKTGNLGVQDILLSLNGVATNGEVSAVLTDSIDKLNIDSKLILIFD